MQVSRILAEIDAEIAKLQQARALLAPVQPETHTGRGRPKGSKNAGSAKPAVAVKTVVAVKTRKRKLSPEGRKRIADAMKKRWAERRKQNAKA